MARLPATQLYCLGVMGFRVGEALEEKAELRSPEKGIKFADMPHGIAAISKAPGPFRLVLVLRDPIWEFPKIEDPSTVP